MSELDSAAEAGKGSGRRRLASTEEIVGYEVFSGDVGACNRSIIEWIVEGRGLKWLACLNPHSYAVAKGSPEFAVALRDADWLVADGVGVVLASRVLGGHLQGRVTGSDVFLGVTRSLQEAGGGRVFFLGSTEDTLRRIRAKMAAEFPQVEVVGTYSPPFKPTYSPGELAEMARLVNASRADVLWVGLTAPKQELWIHAVRGQLEVKFVAAIGAVFDFYVGRIQRSPAIFQRLGLEWLPRLIQEPRRLWRRTFVSAPIFLADVARARIRNARGSGE